MDLGLDEPGARERLFVVLEEIRQLGQQIDDVAADPEIWHRPGSKIGRLIADLPEPHVDVRRTMACAVSGLRGALDTVSTLITSGVPTSPESLAILCRTALLASCRLLVLVGPDDVEQARENTLRVMMQESRSLGHLYRRAAEFKRLRALVPPRQVIELHERRHAELQAEGKRAFTEIEMVELAADVVGDMMRAAGGEEEEHATTRSEHLVWIFNTYSGVSHAFAWPTMVAGTTNRLPGDFVADLGTTVAVAGMAVYAFLKAAEERGDDDVD
ncbi:hypothetical protein FDO65_06895 [Nakamurella flava]|uniref:Uncharacterized protein n=1 Tax=Nakamurella flava TaxID=2576308 RepID=A0A4U6QLC6_9ACTN|nr:hypothetical protein [Nakamurella flava]TKV61324.1 hypothetical protein FDO65_06895 [Nakamurella flava]